MVVSLAVGMLMLAAKCTAWVLTGSTAIYSDAAESVVHVVAVAFAAFSLWLSQRPASSRLPWGYERIAFFSAGFEGLVIVAVATAIIVEAVHRWQEGIAIHNLEVGVSITVAAVLVNGALGWYLLRTGRRTRSLILVADGKHVLTDSWTSLGAVVGLSLVLLTGWTPFDPIFAILTAANILWTGLGLVWQAGAGLMDAADPRTVLAVRERLDRISGELGVGWHDLQCRDTGRRLLVTVHVLFPYERSIGEAHRTATELEHRLAADLGRPAEVVTHLEAVEDHADVHATGT